MKKKILVVDDLDLITEVARMTLVHMGFDVEIANSGKQALELIPQYQPDLVISDIDMPDLDGTELAKRIPFGTPIILMTGNLHKNVSKLENLAREGFTVSRILSKPFPPSELKSAVESSLNLK